MYRYTWFEEKDYLGDIDVPQLIDFQGWVTLKEEDYISVSTWEEHCLECSAPLCYSNCQKYVARTDTRCKKTHYGIKKRNDLRDRFPNAVQLKYKEWGKLESHIYKGVILFAEYRRLDDRYQKIDQIGRNICCKINNYKLSDWSETLKERIVRRINAKEKCNSFLFQCYSERSDSYKLIVEFSENTVFFRKSIDINKGFNQALLDVSDVKFDLSEHIYVKIYPENNIEAELVILFSDFICYKENVAKLPAQNVKCVAWDLDNTVWDGTLIECNPNNLRLRDGVLETIKALDRRGIIQVIVSKNDEKEVLPQLKRLNIFDYFVYVVANWSPKSQNILQIAKWLNINVDTFAFIDDSNFERGEVGENIPCVRIYSEKQIDSLLMLPEFDVPVTEDSIKRREMYQIEAKRRSIKENFDGNNVEFLKECQLKAVLNRFSEQNFERSYELVQRTNQLNLSGIKYDKSEFRNKYMSSEMEAFVVSSSDKYGEYGQVGFFAVKTQDKIAYIKEYVMSCRVAGKYIEPAIVSWISNRYNTDKIVFEGKDSKKNGLLIRTLKEFGFENTAIESDLLCLEIEIRNTDWPDVVRVIEELDEE